jgi:hypothetical protein
VPIADEQPTMRAAVKQLLERDGFEGAWRGRRRRGDRCLPPRTLHRFVPRAVPNIKSERPAETRDVFVDLMGFEVSMDLRSFSAWLERVPPP